MQGTLRTAHLVVGAIAIVAFLITGMLMNAHRPPVMQMDWDQRLLFNSRHIYLMAAGLVNLALGVHYRLPELSARLVVDLLPQPRAHVGDVEIAGGTVEGEDRKSVV